MEMNGPGLLHWPVHFVKGGLEEIYCIMMHFQRFEPSKKRLHSGSRCNITWSSVEEERYVKLDLYKKNSHSAQELFFSGIFNGLLM